MLSTIYSKKKTGQRKLTVSNSMHNLNENNNYLMVGGINKAKNNLIENFNPSRSSKNIFDFDKKLPFLYSSLDKKMEINDIERTDRIGKIYFK